MEKLQVVINISKVLQLLLHLGERRSTWMSLFRVVLLSVYVLQLHFQRGVVVAARTSSTSGKWAKMSSVEAPAHSFEVTPINISSGELPAPSSDVLLTDLFPPTIFYRSFYPTWSPTHLQVSRDQRIVKLKLDRYSGCGVKSLEKYHHGFFSASIKLPGNYSAGVVTTFYMSNNEVYPKNHDEVDFEFLGTVPGEPYTIQTNIYGNGVTHIGREQRFRLWFDPTESFHNYSFLWTANHTIFFVDNIPIWEFTKLEEIGAQYPSKQMSLYATIWDASRWATDGGRYRVDYQYQPFTATYADFIIKRCPSYSLSRTISPDLCTSVFNLSNPSQLTAKQQEALKWVQVNHRVYSYCADVERYPNITDIPECAAERAQATNQTRLDHANSMQIPSKKRPFIQRHN